MIVRLYNFFSQHKRLLLTGYICFILVSIGCLAVIPQEENIHALLPDSGSNTVRRDFELLQQSPFARKVLIDLHVKDPAVVGTTDGDRGVTLKNVAEQLSQILQPPIFTQALFAPPLQQSSNFYQVLLRALPNLVTEGDLDNLAQRLTAQSIAKRLQDMRNQLLTPQGWWIKQSLRSDPLQLWQIAAGHLRALNPMTKSDQGQTDFISSDGTHRLLVVDTAVDISDVSGSRELVKQLNLAIAACVPEHIEATVISGHLYTLANASTIKRDLKVVLGTASFAILLIFVLLLRSWCAVYVFLLPASVLGIAAAAVAIFFPTVSGITIGFGAVLLGITVDFTLHVYFALRGHEQTDGQPVQQLSRITEPLAAGALTSFLAFSILLFSVLPGQRQLAVFSMTAIAIALALALVVMPHLCGVSTRVAKIESVAVPRRSVSVLFLWGVVMLLCVVAIPSLHFDGAMRSLSVNTATLQSNEKLFQQVWGNMRSSAMVFAVGDTLEEAEEINAQISSVIEHAGADATMVSLASIVPSAARQKHSRDLWQRFWQHHSVLAQERLVHSGAALGFAPQAFAPFFNTLGEDYRPVDLATWKLAGLSTIVDSLSIVGAGNSGSYKLITLINEGDLLPGLRHQLEDVDGAIVVAQGNFAEQLGNELVNDFRRFIALALAVVIMVLVVWYRNWRSVVLALLPVIGGLVFMLGMMGWMTLSFNLFNVIATILIIGLSVDYGIFMLSLCDGSGCRQSRQAVLVSALTTLAGFGALVLAQHPAMYSIGITVLLGISGGAVTALFVVPVAYRWLIHD